MASPPGTQAILPWVITHHTTAASPWWVSWYSFTTKSIAHCIFLLTVLHFVLVSFIPPLSHCIRICYNPEEMNEFSAVGDRVNHRELQLPLLTALKMINSVWWLKIKSCLNLIVQPVVPHSCYLLEKLVWKQKAPICRSDCDSWDCKPAIWNCTEEQANFIAKTLACTNICYACWHGCRIAALFHWPSAYSLPYMRGPDGLPMDLWMWELWQQGRRWHLQFPVALTYIICKTF